MTDTVTLTRDEAESLHDFIECGFIEFIKAVPGLEIVFCDDCRYWQDNNGGYPHEECRWGHDETPEWDDYCSFGVAIEGEDDADK